jgi:hypothetical protein
MIHESQSKGLSFSAVFLFGSKNQSKKHLILLLSLSTNFQYCVVFLSVYNQRLLDNLDMAVSFGHKMIESRKRADNAYREMDAVMVADRKIFQMANFENVTANKIESRMKREQFEKRKQEHEVKLHDRRQQLADLYNSEIETWRAQVLANVETLEDRQARIMERAYALRDAREKERMSLVKEKYDEQWRDACDDARTLDSKAMTKYMNKERIQQIQDKIKRKQQVSSQENSFLDEWNRQLEELERRDRDKQDLRRRIDHETSNEIKAQVSCF